MILNVNSDPKMLRETLCLAQSALNSMYILPSNKPHSDRLQGLIDECDRHRPLGPDGKHGDLHTETCGCNIQPLVAPCRRMDLHDQHDWFKRTPIAGTTNKVQEALTYCPGRE